MRIQPRIKGKDRFSVKRGETLDDQTDAAITFTAEKFNCSKSWVKRFILGEFFGIAVPDFRKLPPKKKGKAR